MEASLLLTSMLRMVTTTFVEWLLPEILLGGRSTVVADLVDLVTKILSLRHAVFHFSQLTLKRSHLVLKLSVFGFKVQDEGGLLLVAVDKLLSLRLDLFNDLLVVVLINGLDGTVCRSSHKVNKLILLSSGQLVHDHLDEVQLAFTHRQLLKHGPEYRQLVLLTAGRMLSSRCLSCCSHHLGLASLLGHERAGRLPEHIDFLLRVSFFGEDP